MQKKESNLQMQKEILMQVHFYERVSMFCLISRLLVWYAFLAVAIILAGLRPAVLFDTADNDWFQRVIAAYIFCLPTAAIWFVLAGAVEKIIEESRICDHLYAKKHYLEQMLVRDAVRQSDMFRKIIAPHPLELTPEHVWSDSLRAAKAVSRVIRGTVVKVLILALAGIILFRVIAP